jgi:hypothetical protein
MREEAGWALTVWKLWETEKSVLIENRTRFPVVQPAVYIGFPILVMSSLNEVIK